MRARLESEWEHGGQCIGVAEASRRLVEQGLAATDLHTLAGGKANSTFGADLERIGRVVVRFQQRDAEAGAFEQAVAERLAGLVPVARVLEHFPEAGFSLVEWKPGDTLEQLAVEGRTEEIKRVAGEIGDVCRTLDAIQFESAGFLSNRLSVRDPWPSAIAGFQLYLEGCRQSPSLIRSTGTDRLERIDRAIERFGPDLQRNAGPPRLAHGDFKPSNLLVHNGRLSAVLDWEFAHAGSWLSDVGQILRHDAELPSAFRAGVLATSGRSEEEAVLARAMDLINLVGFLSRSAAAPTMKAAVLALVDRSLTELAEPPFNS